MAISLQRKMRDETPNSCRALITTRNANIPPNSPLSYFINITIPQPKIRIKIPKLLVKTMQRRSHRCNDTDADHHSKNKNKRAKPKKLLSKKVGSIFSGVFGNKKSTQMCSNSNGNGGNLGSVQRTKTSSANSLNYGDQPFSLAPDHSPVSESHSLNGILEIEDEEVKQKRLDDRKNSNGSIFGDMPPVKLPRSFASLFHKKTGLNFTKGKIYKTSCKSSSSSSTVESSGDLARIPARIPATLEKKNTKPTRKKVKKRVEEEEDGEKEERGDYELCKKRILMGERCRPLNIS